MQSCVADEHRCSEYNTTAYGDAYGLMGTFVVLAVIAQLNLHRNTLRLAQKHTQTCTETHAWLSTVKHGYREILLPHFCRTALHRTALHRNLGAHRCLLSHDCNTCLVANAIPFRAMQHLPYPTGWLTRCVDILWCQACCRLLIFCILFSHVLVVQCLCWAGVMIASN